MQPNDYYRAYRQYLEDEEIAEQMNDFEDSIARSVIGPMYRRTYRRDVPRPRRS